MADYEPRGVGDFSAIIDVVRRPRDGEADLAEGHRERKKRLTRQQISDTATGMFIDRGFDEVRVADVAAVCGVSEKTVYNYFPTKESLVLDNEEAMVALVRRSLGPDAPEGSPIDVVVNELLRENDEMYARFDDFEDPNRAVTVIQQFSVLIESTPSLRAAQRDMMDRLTTVAAEALAARAGVDPSGPEPQIAAGAIVDLWRIELQSMKRHSDGSHTTDEIHDAVVEDIRRAARLIDTGLWSFNLVVQGTDTRQQMKVAAEAANDARKQVVVAVRAARKAWLDVATELKAHKGHEAAGDRGGARARTTRAATRDRQQTQRQVQSAKREMQKAQRDLQRAAADVRQAARVAKANRPPR